MPVMTEWQTIEWLIENRGSISRYGDGELKLCTGRAAKSQPASPVIRERLCQILKQPIGNHLVGIPRVTGRKDFCSLEKQRFWEKYNTDRYRSLYLKWCCYGSAFITRPDAAPMIDTPDYFLLIKKLWKDRHVILVKGNNCGFLKRSSLFDGVKSHDIILAPDTDAFSVYGDILKQLTVYPADTLFVLSLGPTATVLAYDLARIGYQALDLGHLGQFYSHVHPKSTGTVYETTDGMG